MIHFEVKFRETELQKTKKKKHAFVFTNFCKKSERNEVKEIAVLTIFILRKVGGTYPA